MEGGVVSWEGLGWSPPYIPHNYLWWLLPSPPSRFVNPMVSDKLRKAKTHSLDCVMYGEEEGGLLITSVGPRVVSPTCPSQLFTMNKGSPNHHPSWCEIDQFEHDFTIRSWAAKEYIWTKRINIWRLAPYLQAHERIAKPCQIVPTFLIHLLKASVVQK